MLSSKKFADVLRILSIDMVQKARSGHPGMPLGMADIAAVLWRQVLRCNPKNPSWINRDRFVLSNGHGVALLYAALYLTGHALTLADLKAFRQLHACTPGHPEFGETPGVDATTGPLGQGLGMAVGMAVAEKGLAAQFNRESFPLVDHYTYAFVGDGCLMEGISHEVCALAGTLGLGKLIVFYDDNGISIDGPVHTWFSEDTAKRFAAYDWQVIEAVDGHNASAVKSAIEQAHQCVSKPTLIICKTLIGAGSPKENSAAVHGAPLGEAGIAQTRKNLGWDFPPFEIPEEIASAWDRSEYGARLEQEWIELFNTYQANYPELAEEFLRRTQKETAVLQSEDIETALVAYLAEHQAAMATRKASQMALDFFGARLPEIFGGSADLTGSNCTAWSGSKPIISSDFSGNYLHYGVREFGMAAISNGLALHGGWVPYCGTFLVFSDYARNAIRLSGLMQQKVIYILTHDSIGLGEDGPTHQPIEQAASLRIMPNVAVWRPCDLAETLVAWKVALSYKGPSCLLLSRQSLPVQNQARKSSQSLIEKGGYVLQESPIPPQGVFIATGSEVPLAKEAAEYIYEKHGIGVRVVSFPCIERFKEQSKAYRESVLPTMLKARVAVEAGVPTPWYEFVGEAGAIIGIETYGKSAPAEALSVDFGFTVEHVESVMLRVLGSAAKAVLGKNNNNGNSE